ncbi:MAG: hypothetical protein QE485_04245, partial [Acidovorax sp.]|uniref:hypothetical protein n=1 Tax=Acidovorax sp. TaxID=1872122 RepID=UPI00261465ED
PDSRLTEGQSLSIPGQVSGLHNTAQTHKPYDPTEVVGDTTPNMPAPPVDEGGGCGILGKIIMIVVAVAVTAVTGGAGGAVSSFWGGVLGQGSAAAAVATAATATAAAAGSVASQAVGVAIGAQSKFSWKNVALAAISGGVSGGLAEVNFTGGDSLYSLGNTVIRSALGSTISQGIGVATGLQKSFDWKSVAGAAVGAGVGWGVGQALGSNANTLVGASLRSFAAGAATALVRGGKISITQVAVDAFGSALGDGLGDALRVGLGQSQSQENSPAFMEGGAGGGGGSGNGHYEPDNGPDWGTGAVAGQPTLTAGDFARMDRASEEVWAAQGGAWEQPGTAATDRAFLEAFQNPGALAPTGEGVLMAAGPGYSGGLELRDRLPLGSREDNSLFEEASALAANAMQADNRRAAWVQTQAQAASAQYAQGYGDVHDTSPAAGLMVNPETGLADFRYTSQTLNSGSTSSDKLFAASGAAAAYAGEGDSVFMATGVNPGSMESPRQADGAYRLEIGGSDGITGPSIGSLSANSGTGSYENPRAWIGNEIIVRERADTMLPEDLRRFELESRNRNEQIEPTTGSALADEAIQRAAGTVLGGAGIVHGGVQFASDQVWAVGNAVTAGWLANNVPAAQAATARNIELGNSLLNLPGQISRGTLRAVTGNWHGAAQSASNALQLNQIQAANTRGDYLSAQVMTTQTAINVAGLAMGGVGAARAGLGMAAVQDVRMGAQLAVQDAAANLSVPRQLNSQFGGGRIGGNANISENASIASGVKGPYRGGPHSETRPPINDGFDSHHMPDRNADPRVSANSGPAIQMDPLDHAATSSNGKNGRAGFIYRTETADMIGEGRYRDAMAREIWGVRRSALENSGSRIKYIEAIQEMLLYSRMSGQLPQNPRTGR